MYYVAKVYKHMQPSIVECFQNEEHAKTFAKVMSEAKNEPYIVLTTI